MIARGEKVYVLGWTKSYTLWDSGCTHSFNPYFYLYTEYHPIEEGYNTRVNDIGGTIEPKYLGTISLYLEYDA